MHRKNPFLIIGLAIFSLLSLTGIGFSLFYVGNTSASRADTAAVDDIEENVALQDAGNSDSYFTVYFFVQEQAANVANPLDYVPSRNEQSGYWLDSKLPSGVTAQGNDGKYGYRMLTVYRSISVEQFETIGEPRTTAKDSQGTWTFGFSGWTANREAARNCILHRQGDFKYVDAFTSLTNLDQNADDGSLAGDNTIFLYPIYSTGKDYTLSDSKEKMQPIVEIVDYTLYKGDNGNDSNGEIFFSQEGSYNESTYRYNNFTISQADISGKRYGLRISELSGGGFFWPSMSDSTGWTGGWYSIDSSLLFALPGTYNITAKVFFDAGNFGCDRSSWNHRGDFNEKYINEKYGTIDSFIESEEGVIVNSYKAHNTNDCDFFSYILVERVYEFHLMGGPYGTFDYNGDTVRPFYDGNIYKEGYTPSAGTNQFVITYGLNNVFIDASGTTFDDRYIGNPDNNPSEYQASGIFKRNVFTIDAQNLIQQNNDTFWKNGLEAFTDAELAQLSSDTGQTYSTITADGLLQEAVARLDESQTDYDYSLTREGTGYFEAYRTMLKVTRTGYYNFRIQVTFKKSIASETEQNNIVNFVESIKVAVAPVVKPYFFKIFDSNQFEHYTVDNENGNHVSSDHGTGFVEHNCVSNSNLTSSGNRLLYQYEFHNFGEILNLNTQFKIVSEDGTEGGSVSLGDILNQHKLFDHVTGLELTSERVSEGTFQLQKNYVFYTQ